MTVQTPCVPHPETGGPRLACGSHPRLGDARRTNEAGMCKKRKGLMKTCRIQRFAGACRPRLKGDRPSGCHPRAGRGPAARSRKDEVAPVSGGRAPFAESAIWVQMAALWAPSRPPYLPPPTQTKNKPNKLFIINKNAKKQTQNKPKQTHFLAGLGPISTLESVRRR